MQRPYNDRWERTRRYLLRNLFDYHGDLSPIPEEPRSDSSEEPASPLPELVVEREPNRHDHGEDFYRQLEVRMRRYYRRLFIDGASVHEAEPYDAEDISSEFEVNKSMASTFIIDTNNRPTEKSIEYYSVTIDESRNASKNEETQSTYLPVEERTVLNEVTFVTDDKDMGSKIRELSRSHVETNDGSDVNTTMNKTLEAPESDKTTKSTESDLGQSCHRISTTVAQVHEEGRVRAPRVFEDGSPVLLPKAQQLSRTVFGNISRNIMSAVHEDNGEDFEKDNGKDVEEINESDLEVEWLMKSVDSVSDPNLESMDTSEEEESYKDLQDGTAVSSSTELVESDEDLRPIEDENASLLHTSESDGVIRLHDEESIGPNDFDRIESGRKETHLHEHEDDFVEPYVSSFEMAIRKGLFERKNARKTLLSSSDDLEEDSNGNEEFEPVEAMRGTMQTRLTDSLRRESTTSKGSPLVAQFATQATAEKLDEEEVEYDVTWINTSDVAMTETIEKEKDNDLGRDLSTSQDGLIIGGDGHLVDTEKSTLFDGLEDSNRVFDALLGEDHTINKNTVADTPPVSRMRSIVDVCDDVWSVSPVHINIEELSRRDKGLPTSIGEKNQLKRVSDTTEDVNAPMNKKKKYNNSAIQTSDPKETVRDWDCVKNNLFVGKPLVFRLCHCDDHVCSHR